MDAENKRTHDEDFDRWLDSALRARIEAEPRMGMEERVLARLSGKYRDGFAWWPAVAIAAAVVVIAIAVVWLRPTQPEPAVTNATIQPANSAAADTASAQRTSARNAPNGSSIRMRRQSPSTSSRDTACCLHANAVVRRRSEKEQLPRLATFPAPRPATAEERMLAQLATQLAARRQFSEMANLSIDAVPKDLSIRELNVEPLETAPADFSPQE